MSLVEFVIAVLLYSARTGASSSSWFRTTAHNHKVGGVEHSAHLAGLAVDVVYDDSVPLSERLAWATRFGLRLIAEGDHDHLQPLGWTAG